MEGQVDALVSRNRTVDGVPTSLLDLGYVDIGLDDNWQDCGAGVNGSFHNAKGQPIINLKRFPNMTSYVQYGHNKRVRMGWYQNNCICAEHHTSLKKYHGDVNAIVGYKFDGVKLDNCGASKNLTLWAELLNKTGRPVLIENCHWGLTVPTETWCPFNFFRSSGDISPNWDRIIANLQTTKKFQQKKNPLSRPGCWAYPDMLEVGNIPQIESRSHFGAWCIVSSPLTLGFDMTDNTKMDEVWDIITNKEAIAVNQAWQGHPGYQAKVYPTKPNPNNMVVNAIKCNTSSPSQVGWSFKNGAVVVDNKGSQLSAIHWFGPELDVPISSR
eukprot:TRINITY_DN67255_c4_g1_i1.p1 TRINITY_DN67255_c4_g1~~TRINITY_DN67255_c4_g1_i1.p1  ORF type:complete len:378 (-),score=24.30 TRINITY_DN67255_c4_g1_i1:364-1344(-)